MKQVRYACKEYACSAADVLALRTRLAFLSYQAAEEALPRVLQIMKEELGWSDERVEQERQKAIKLIEVDMGKNVRMSLFFGDICFLLLVKVIFQCSYKG